MAIALYIHWPFCKSKCPYCDFNSHVREGVEQKSWLAAYQKSFDYFAEEFGPRRVSSVFFGGGTPSLMEPELVRGILEHVSARWPFLDNAEITLEANPTSVEAEKFRRFCAAGINRLSLGVQALDDKALKFLGREHGAQEALAALDLARDIFPRYSFDLIYARPEQTVEEWRRELGKALELAGDHVSLYQLTIEKGTPFYAAHQAGAFTIPGEETAAVLYELTGEMLASAGFDSYEVSNYARPGGESRHNLAYWRYGEYLGIGPGAHSRLQIREGREALVMIHQPEAWLESVRAHGHGLQSGERVTGRDMLAEMLMMGLRLKEGIPRARFLELCSAPPESLLSAKTLAALAEEGLIELDGAALRATKKGRLVLNSVVSALADV